MTVDRVKVADGFVTRPAGPQSSTVHAFLRYLRAQGLEVVPEPVSLDGTTEVLRYIEGDSGGDAWRHQHDDAGLRSAARLLRLIHDASESWQPPDDAMFEAPPVQTGAHVFCHGDPGPWNFVWRDGEAVALLDWEFLHPGPRLGDLAYAPLWFSPMRADAACLDWHHFAGVPDRRLRMESFIDAYGLEVLPTFDAANAIISRRRATMTHIRSLASRGVEPQRTWVAEGTLASEEAEIAWVEAHRFLLSRDGIPGLDSHG